MFICILIGDHIFSSGACHRCSIHKWSHWLVAGFTCLPARKKGQAIVLTHFNCGPHWVILLSCSSPHTHLMQCVQKPYAVPEIIDRPVRIAKKSTARILLGSKPPPLDGKEDKICDFMISKHAY